MIHWTQAYVGIPYLDRGRSSAGADCYGLAWLIYRDELQIDLPSHDEHYASAGDSPVIEALIDDARGQATWCVQAQARPFDLLVFRRGRYDAHIGISIAQGRMIHMIDGQQAVIATVDNGIWLPRLSGIYRHFSLLPEDK